MPSPKGFPQAYDWETAETMEGDATQPSEGPIAIWLDHHLQQRQQESLNTPAASAFTSGGENGFMLIEMSRPEAVLFF
ncbi:hypothetical protein DCS_05375 [Drechmeria coniospora]|uniref:Uncharacterized protein n=1 Tax=Drechmeria coniospora TaxID=98403 RepID=A0A151GMY9_DRECN|nr:hypothetical protein DCS_05375 [Drechmeria coniospora]KYK58362.1 hypothetical protein DCS_05375 [Drechmeria coniospora]